MPGPAPVVLAFGLKPERLVDSEGRIDAFVEAPRQDQVGRLVEAVTSVLDAGGGVVAIVPTWFAPEGLMRLQMVQALLDTDRLAVHRTALPPLAGAALASLASAVGRHVPGPGVLASLLPALEAELHVFTWLGSVAGLGTPTPTRAQHMASLGPGAAFGVSSWPQPSVHRLRGTAVTVPVPPIGRPSRLAVASRSGDSAWIRGSVNAALGELEIREVGPTPHGVAWWGTGKLAESVAYPLDVEALASDLQAALTAWECRWCGELVARMPCPLCGHVGRPRTRSGPVSSRS